MKGGLRYYKIKKITDLKKEKEKRRRGSKVGRISTEL